MEQIEYELTYKNFLESMKVLFKSHPRWKRIRIICGIALVAVIHGIMTEPSNEIHWFFLFYTSAYLFYPVLIWPFLAKLNYKNQKQVHGPSVLVFDDGSISFKTKAVEAKHRWIFDYSVARDAIVIYPIYTYSTSHIILRKYCQNDDQFQRIVSLLKKLKDAQISDEGTIAG